MKTHEGAKTHEHSLDHALELFSKGGSLFANRKSFYGSDSDESVLSLFQKSWIGNAGITMKLLLWLRDIRGGAGNRSGFRECLKWLGDHNPEWVIENIEWIPMVGRWDDLRSLFGTASESRAAQLWSTHINDGDVLAAKWADRKDKPLRYILGMNESQFRKFLANIRKDHIVEHKMCSKLWNKIEYSKVPSVAMARYTKTFMKNDEERFAEYKMSLKSGKETIHADTLFPHDCVRTANQGDAEIANAQFKALPNFLEGTNENIVVLADTSGSMKNSHVSGLITACDISQGLALYCSNMIPKDNPFHKKFIAFCNEGQLQSWDGMEFSAAIQNRRIFDRAIGATRIDLALNTLLEYSVKRQVKDVPTVLLIVSDMQFAEGCRTDFPVEDALQDWDIAGLKRPRIVYWNTVGYAGSPDTVKGNDVAMVSGFSTGILKSILGGDDFTPKGVMLRALEKYKVTDPLFGDFAEI